MTMRRLRLVVVIAVSVLTSGIPHVLAAAVDDECCTEACDGSPDGKRCPPNCNRGTCAKVSVSLGAVLAPTLGLWPTRSEGVFVAAATPELPLVVAGVFHPPIA